MLEVKRWPPADIMLVRSQKAKPANPTAPSNVLRCCAFCLLVNFSSTLRSTVTLARITIARPLSLKNSLTFAVFSLMAPFFAFSGAAQELGLRLARSAAFRKISVSVSSPRCSVDYIGRAAIYRASNG